MGSEARRQWIGIDITHLAISLIEKRLNDAFPGIRYDVHGDPMTRGARISLTRTSINSNGGRSP